MTFENWWKDYGKDQDSCEYIVAKDAFKAGQEAGDEKIADVKANCDLAIECRDIKIRELEQQIEKMKCCGNCKHFNFNEPNYCHKGVYRERQYVCSEWEFGN
jgi:hypothetical protein